VAAERFQMPDHDPAYGIHATTKSTEREKS